MDDVRLCKKCSGEIEADEDGENTELCDNCHMDLIAQNLAAELLSHQVVDEEEGGCVADAPIGVSTSNDGLSSSIKSEKSSLEEKDTNEHSSEQHAIKTEDIVKTEGEDVPVEIKKSEESDKTTQKEEENVAEDSNVDKADKPDEEPSDGSEVNSDTRSPLPSPEGSDESDDGGDNSWRHEKRRRGSTTTEEEQEEEEVEVKEVKSIMTNFSAMVTRRGGARFAYAGATMAEAIARASSPLPVPSVVLNVGEDSGSDDDVPIPPRRLTRRAIAEIDKFMHPQYETQVVNKSRRSKMFKSTQVYKAPTAQARIYPSDYVFHKGRYYQIGDVCAMQKYGHPRQVFYCQITSLLTDQYCHKCATIQWLFPTKESPDPSVAFDARTYYLGFIDETPRPLDTMMPVMNCPPNYFSLEPGYEPSPTKAPHSLYIRLRPMYVSEFLPATPQD